MADGLLIRDGPEGVFLTVHVQPRAAETAYAGPHGGALKFRVAAPPADGAANEALCAYLAERFGLPKWAVQLKAGAAARQKVILLKGVSRSRVRAVLGLAEEERA